MGIHASKGEQGSQSYEVIEDWAKVPEGWSLVEVAGVAVDSDSRVYLFNRGKHPMIVLDSDGNFVKSWGEALFSRAHNARIGPDGSIYCADVGDHTVRRLTLDGEVLLTLGTPNVPSDTGCERGDYRTIRRGAGPFNKPTDIAFGRAGEMFVSDGYGNARVHRFSRGGALLESWGEPGGRHGEFNLPHGVLVDPKRDRLYVADRENSRIQVFDLGGGFVAEWVDVNRPTCITRNNDGTLIVSELGYLAGMPTGSVAPAGRDPTARITIRSPEQGSILSEWKIKEPCAAGGFFAPHSVGVSPRGDVYVAEVNFTAQAPGGCHTVQKFSKL